MISQWNDVEASRHVNDDLAMRVYTSRLLGSKEDLVMHGGGNTSVKGAAQDFSATNSKCSMSKVVAGT